jgi:hypothetical protein
MAIRRQQRQYARLPCRQAPLNVLMRRAGGEEAEAIADTETPSVFIVQPRSLRAEALYFGRAFFATIVSSCRSLRVSQKAGDSCAVVARQSTNWSPLSV